MIHNFSINSPHFFIKFANNDKFHLIPTDPEAEKVVNRLALVMNLSSSQAGIPIYVTVNTDGPPPALPDDKGRLTCIIRVQHEILQMAYLARYIALLILPHGGLLIHGALIEKDGQGIILTGPGTVGKSTACKRIPPPWNPLCDDTTLVVPDKSGHYFAHPWPTWSRLLSFGPWQAWDVERAVELYGIFILSQSSGDGIEELTHDEKVPYLINSLQYQPLGLNNEYSLDDMKTLYHKKSIAIESLVQGVPVQVLKISLTGQFWEIISSWLETVPHRVLEMTATRCDCRAEPPADNTDSEYLVTNLIPVIYMGTSMNPVFYDYDLLRVLPYADRNPEPGDIICFYPPGTKKMIIHRIIQTTPSGIRTQGDNNPSQDENSISLADITGKVMEATRGNQKLLVPGGRKGMLVFHRNRFRRYFRGMIFFLYKRVYPVLTRFRLINSVTRKLFRPRIVLFSSYEKNILRLFIGNHLIGNYNPETKKWAIPFPYWLIVDENNLPPIDLSPINNP